MSALLITPDVVAAVLAATERARDRTIPWSILSRMVGKVQVKTPTLKLADRPADFQRPDQPVMLIIPIDYRCSIAFEQQPTGLCRHLSVSVREGEGGACPSVPAMTEIATLFGFRTFPPVPGRIWVEEFAPGRHAVNVIEIVEESHASHENQS